MRFLALLASFGLLFCCETIQPALAQDTFEQLTEQAREWTVKTPDGGTKKLDASLIGLKRGVAEFKQKDGKTLSVPLDQLSQEDRRAALIDRVGSGVVEITTKDLFGEKSGLGSGFVMHASGLILTNYHVIAGAGEVELSFRDHKEAVPVEVLSVDRLHDVAYLRVKELPADVQVLELQSGRLPSPGSSVWTLGHPSGLKNTVGWGDINAVRKSSELPEVIREALKTPDASNWLQTNAVLAHGSSGGPLLNTLGQVVGINTFLMQAQLGFAIHISHAQAAYLEAKKETPLTLPLPPGEHQDALAWPSREVAPLLKQYAEEYGELERAAARMPEAEIKKRLTALQAKYRDSFFKLAQESPGDWSGMQAMAYAAQFCAEKEAEGTLQQICELALKHNGESRHLSAIVKAVGSQPSDSARAFCRKVKEVTPHRMVQLQASYQLAANQLRYIQLPDSLNLEKITTAREEVEQVIKELEAEVKDEESPIHGEDSEFLVDNLRDSLDYLPIGLKAKEIKGVDIEGKTFKLSDYEGKAILLDFFADWCPHCRKMYPNERDMVVKMKDRPFAILGVHCENQSILTELVKNKTVTWRSWADGEAGPITTAWNVDSFPTLYLLDHQGIVRWQSNGAPDEQELAEMIEELVAEAETKESK